METIEMRKTGYYMVSIKTGDYERFLQIMEREGIEGFLLGDNPGENPVYIHLTLDTEAKVNEIIAFEQISILSQNLKTFPSTFDRENFGII